MKQLFVVLFAIVSFSANANGQSMLKVRLTDNSPITVSVDGRYFNKRGTSITVGDLPYGIHTLRIFGNSYSRWGHGYQEVIYRGRVRTFNGSITYVVYDPYNGDLRINEENLRSSSDERRNNDGGYNRGYDDNENRNNAVQNDPRDNNNRDINNKPAENVTNDAAPPAALPGASPVKTEEPTLTESRINKLKTKVAAKGTDTEKMKLLEESLKGDKISTFQVSVIMDWFSFESSKVEFAKWAYNMTTDKEFYPDLAGKFSFKDSQDELDKFLKSRK